MNPDFLPTASLDQLRRRAEIIKRIRNFFDDRDFLEVETPILSHDTCVDRHLQPIELSRHKVCDYPSKPWQDPERLWLQTSPEFGMKRILAAGAEAIYQITKSFRSGERGSRHNPEFTMLEWYRVGDDQQKGMDLLSEFVTEVIGQPSSTRVSYQRLFETHLGINPHKSSVAELQEICRQHQISVEHGQAESADIDFWLNLLLSQFIEDELGHDVPTIVFDWPASQSALAIVRDGESPVAERFELFVDGVELANGYHELLDPAELRKRNRMQNEWRQRDGNSTLPENSLLLEAMEHGIAGCAGVALGVDRLVMLATDSSSIEDVIAFPFERA